MQCLLELTFTFSISAHDSKEINHYPVPHNICQRSGHLSWTHTDEKLHCEHQTHLKSCTVLFSLVLQFTVAGPGFPGSARLVGAAGAARRTPFCMPSESRAWSLRDRVGPCAARPQSRAESRSSLEPARFRARPASDPYIANNGGGDPPTSRRGGYRRDGPCIRSARGNRLPRKPTASGPNPPLAPGRSIRASGWRAFDDPPAKKNIRPRPWPGAGRPACGQSTKRMIGIRRTRIGVGRTRMCPSAGPSRRRSRGWSLTRPAAPTLQGQGPPEERGLVTRTGRMRLQRWHDCLKIDTALRPEPWHQRGCIVARHARNCTGSAAAQSRPHGAQWPKRKSITAQTLALALPPGHWHCRRESGALACYEHSWEWHRGPNWAKPGPGDQPQARTPCHCPCPGTV